jgi:Tol biopolymer transport system component
MSSFTGPITPDLVSSSSQMSDISLSPDGRKLIYAVRPICNKDQNSTTQSSIWIAETDITGSGRRFSSEGEQASSPSFHPDGQTIIYLSDNHQPGGPLQIHSLDLSGDFKPFLLWRGSSHPVTLFSISRSGEYVVFTSADESMGEEDTSAPERLRVYSFATKQVTTISVLNGSHHVNGFVWSPDSRELLFYTWQAKRAEYHESPMPGDQKVIDVYILNVKHASSPRCVGSFNQTPGPWERQTFIWPTPTEVINISKYDPFYRSMDGMATQWHSLNHLTLQFVEVENSTTLIP